MYLNAYEVQSEVYVSLREINLSLFVSISTDTFQIYKKVIFVDKKKKHHTHRKRTPDDIKRTFKRYVKGLWQQTVRSTITRGIAFKAATQHVIFVYRMRRAVYYLQLLF